MLNRQFQIGDLVYREFGSFNEWNSEFNVFQIKKVEGSNVGMVTKYAYCRGKIKAFKNPVACHWHKISDLESYYTYLTKDVYDAHLKMISDKLHSTIGDSL